MRSNLNNVQAFDLRIRNGLQFASVHQTISTTYNMAQDQPVWLQLNPGSGGTLNVILPSMLGTSFGGVTLTERVHVISNVGSVSSLAIKSHADDGSA